MTYKFEVSTSHQRLRQHGVQVRAGLSAVPELGSIVDRWVAQVARITEHRAAWEAALDELAIAQTINRVTDTNWDASYTEGSGLAYLLAKKKKDEEPYRTVFRVPARRATGLGHVKAVEVGDRAIAEARRFQMPSLTGWAETFTTANETLKVSGKAMESAEDALDDPRFSKMQLVRAHNELIAATEAFILTTFPGRGDLADAILIPARERRRAKGDDEGPVGPDLDADDDGPAA